MCLAYSADAPPSAIRGRCARCGLRRGRLHGIRACRGTAGIDIIDSTFVGRAGGTADTSAGHVATFGPVVHRRDRAGRDAAGHELRREVRAVHTRGRRLRRRRRRAPRRERVQHDPPRRAVRVPHAASRAGSTAHYLASIARHRRHPRPAPHLRAARLPPGRLRPGHQRQRHAGVGDLHRRLAQPARSVPAATTSRTRRCSARSTTSGRTGPGRTASRSRPTTRRGCAAVAQRFASSANVIGYEAMNEPWPGTNWKSCTTGCPDLEAAAARAVLRADDRRGPRGRPASSGVRRAVRAVQLRRRRHVASRRDDAETRSRRTCTRRTRPSNAAVMDRSVAAAVRDSCAVARHRVGRDRPTPRRSPRPRTSSTPGSCRGCSGRTTVSSSATASSRSSRRTSNVPVLDALTRPYPSGRERHADPSHLRHRESRR